MDDGTIRSTLLDLLTEIAPDGDPSGIDPDGDLRSELDLDSMDFLNLVEGVAQSTGVDIPEADYGKVRSLRALTDYVTLHARAG